MFSLSNSTWLRGNALRFGAALAAALMPLLAGAIPVKAESLAADVRPPIAPYVLPYSVLDGTPDMSAGEGMGYWLWSDDEGLHLRTTTHGLPHVFLAALRTRESAGFLDVSDVKLEERAWNYDRKVRVEDDTIRFRFVTYDGMDGIDFKLDGGIFCVELENNGHEAIAATHLGADQLRPVSMPVCFKR